MPGPANLGRRHGSRRPAPRSCRHAHHPRRLGDATTAGTGPTTSWSSAPAPAAWPPPSPRPATARACSSSTAGPAPRASPAPPGSTCAPWRSSAPGASPPRCAPAGSASCPRPPRRPPWSRPRGRAAARAATRRPARSSTSAPCCRWPARRTSSSRSSSTPCAGAGGEIRFGTPLAGAAGRGPTASAAELGSGTRVHARFVVGADGTRSTVRAALGIATTHLGTWAHAVQVLFRPRTPLPQPHRLLTFVDEPHPAALCPMGAAAGPTSACGSTAAGPAVPADWTPTLRAATGLPDLDPEVLDVAAVHAGGRGRHDLPRRARVPRRRRRAPDDPRRRDRPEHRDPRRPRAGLEARVGRPRPGRGRAAREPRRRARPRRARRRRPLARRGGPPDRRPAERPGPHAPLAGDRRRRTRRRTCASTSPPGPGERAPHAWVRHAGRHRSTLDLFDGTPHPAHGRGRPTVGAGRGRRRRGVPLRVLVEGRDVHGGTRAAVRVRSRLRGARAARRARRLAARRRLRRPDQRPARERSRHARACAVAHRRAGRLTPPPPPDPWGRHRGRHRHAAVRARIRSGRARRRDGGPAQRRPGARPDAARPARPALVPAAAVHRHRTGGGARRVARARPGHPARPGRARRAVDRPGGPAARRRDHHRPARNAGAPGERVRPAGRTGAHAGRGPRTGVVRAAVLPSPSPHFGAAPLPEPRSPACGSRCGPGQNRRCRTSSDRAGIRSRPPGLASRSLRAARARSGSAVSTTTCHIRPYASVGSVNVVAW